MDSNKGNIILLQKLQPENTFWNWNNPHQSKRKNNKNSKQWKIDEKRFSASELFNPNTRRKSTSETFVLGPGAGAGIGCGVGFGLGLVGGIGVLDGPWNYLRIGFGFGFGCGVGFGFGYGQGFGYGSSWDSIKTDVLGFEN